MEDACRIGARDGLRGIESGRGRVQDFLPNMPPYLLVTSAQRIDLAIYSITREGRLSYLGCSPDLAVSFVAAVDSSEMHRWIIAGLDPLAKLVFEAGESGSVSSPSGCFGPSSLARFCPSRAVRSDRLEPTPSTAPSSYDIVLLSLTTSPFEMTVADVATTTLGFCVNVGRGGGRAGWQHP